MSGCHATRRGEGTSVAVREFRVFGIGGGTCAAYFRKRGFDAVVWSKFDESTHSANEYCIIQNLVDMTKVFSLMMLRA